MAKGKSIDSLLGGAGRFRWDRSSAKFRSVDTGRFVSKGRIDAGVKDFAKRAATRIRELGKRFEAGELDEAEFADLARSEVARLHGSLGTLSYGGVDAITARQREKVAAAVGRQLGFFENLVAQLQSGKQRKDGSLLTRLALYGNAGWSTFENGTRDLLQEDGQGGPTEERRVLANVEHCVDCVEYAALGWQPVGTLPPIGDSVCRANCKCHFEYR